MRNFCKNLKRCFSDDLLSKKYRKLKTEKDDSSFGHCYIATEAAYHLIGKKLGYRPMVMRVEGGKYTHWFLQNENGNVMDPTIDQYLGKTPKYSNAKGCGFLTKKPSKRAQILIDKYKTFFGNGIKM